MNNALKIHPLPDDGRFASSLRCVSSVPLGHGCTPAATPERAMVDEYDIGSGHVAASTTDLLRAANDRDRAAWEELIRRYTGVVRREVATFRLGEHDSADAVQNTWLRLLGSGATIRDPERLGGWLATTARRECLALIRRARAERASDTVGVELPDTGPTPEAVVVAAETRKAVRTTVAGLGGHHKRLIDALFFAPEASYAQVSDRTGVPIGSIGPTRGRALQCLRSELVGWV
jgi:RNA polymerase sigma factor (sigma-70 family)